MAQSNIMHLFMQTLVDLPSYCTLFSAVRKECNVIVVILMVEVTFLTSSSFVTSLANGKEVSIGQSHSRDKCDLFGDHNLMTQYESCERE